METVSRILLSETASRHLLEAGECWMIAGKSSEQPGRVVLHLVPVEKGLADKLCEIAMGTRKAGTRVKAAPAPAEGTSTLSGGKDGITIQRDIHEPSPTTRST